MKKAKYPVEVKKAIRRMYKLRHALKKRGYEITARQRILVIDVDKITNNTERRWLNELIAKWGHGVCEDLFI